MAEELRIRPNGDLASALRDYLTEWSERSGIAVEIWALPVTAVPGRVARVVYTTLVEALSNVERHSRARQVSVAVTAGKAGLRMTVSDDGAGFAVDEVGPGSARGLAAMRARFAEAGGMLTINSVPGGGTTVTGVIRAR
ncbi:sensor histidine kinase [Microtetraspora niveoalba]|uniref:sensor histidine kinase n=1 Tax=Microtetraspora niveoalba TaxID=46175 RepID=UPI00082B9C52|nr:ATP-binding protein [Microtetraspora niveoalba]